MYDRFERNITSLRISVTDRCNLRCRYCMPEDGVPARRPEDFLSFEQIVAVAGAAVGLGITKIRLTGGEPMVKRGIVDLVGMLARVMLRQVCGLAPISFPVMADREGEIVGTNFERKYIAQGRPFYKLARIRYV
jgi:MoaA/NifB/PqqE/SkfB family radical SAM enzyme